MTDPAPILSALEAAVREASTEEAEVMLGRLAIIQVRLWKRALDVGSATEQEDELYDVDQAAAALGMSKWFLYQHRKKLPFAVKVGSRTLYSKALMREWIRKRAGK